MTRTIARTELAQLAAITAQPQSAELPTDRTFELPRALYAWTVGCYAAVLVVFAVGLKDVGLLIPLAICAIYLAMAFGVPSLWTRMQPTNRSSSIEWWRFRRDGVRTAAGPLTAREASVQVLILPVLILVWAIGTMLIVALA